MVPEETPTGGGSGGGPLTTDKEYYTSGTYSITANQVEIISRAPLPPAPPIPGSTIITVMAAGTPTGAFMDGLVNVRGSQGVRVTSGPPMMPPTASESTNGVEVVVHDLGTLTLQRGLIPPASQQMVMKLDGITIDAGVGKVTIESLTEITLSVAGGLTKIKLGPEGVTIEALTIKLSAQLQAEIQALMNQISGTAMNQISGGITMIG
jgi:hypothetical protein